MPRMLNLAQAMRDKGDLPAAVENYRKAIALQPDSADAHADLAFTLKRMDILKEALGRNIHRCPNCAGSRAGAVLLRGDSGANG